jgi:ATP-dependent DNA helicase RecQ
LQRYLDILKTYWGYDEFRPLQADIIQSIASGRDTLGLMPTGGGKSLTFQVPALAMEGVCIVVTPLIALMKDQVYNLKQRGISAVAIYSGMTHKEIMLTLDNAVYEAYKFLYVSPERLATDIFIVKVKQMKVCMIAVDESHCISQWGYDFRPRFSARCPGTGTHRYCHTRGGGRYSGATSFPRKKCIPKKLSPLQPGVCGAYRGK